MSDDQPDDFPSADHLALLSAGETVVQGVDQILTVVAPDRPGLFSRVAGVLALHGLDVLSANGHSDDAGMALEVLGVESSFASSPGTRCSSTCVGPWRAASPSPPGSPTA